MTKLSPAEMDKLQIQVLYELLVDGKSECRGYVFERRRAPGTPCVVLSKDGVEVAKQPLAAVSSVFSLFLFLLQSEASS